MTLLLQLDKVTVQSQVVDILQDITRDWDLDYSGPITGGTRLVADLDFQSIDVVMLIVAIQERFGRKGLPFEKLLMVNGQYVEDVTVRQIVDFLLRVLV